MKDFDAARRARPVRPAEERTFKLGDEIFVRRPVISAWVMTRLDDIAAASPGGTLEIIDELIDEMCEEPAAEKWARLRDRTRDDDPIPLQDVMEVVQWLIVEETTFPTLPPSSSGGSSESPPSGEPSTVVSPSPVPTPQTSALDAFSGQPTPL